ncbi:MAG: peptidase M15 [Flavobacteriia bacterium]|nr:MAG: peptidase M15 [Flavobacteriia bacterium]
MKIIKILKVALVLTFLSFTTQLQSDKIDPPANKNFVYLKELMPKLRVDLRYYGTNNFMGRPLKGYNQPKCMLTKKAAMALKKVQDGLERLGFGLLIYDAYRPQTAVEDIIEWSKDEGDTLMKDKFYPNIDKKDLFKLGYIAEKSAHSRGSTVDLTIVSLTTGRVLNMGGAYDLFDPISNIDYQYVTKNQRALRLLLKRRMEKEGFKSYEKEWWHFTYKNEPFPKTYFDFPVE